MIWERGYGFIAADDGRDYFFHVNALEPGLEFEELQPNLTVSFEVKSGPMRGRAGAARLVRRDLSAGDTTPAPRSAEPPGEVPPHSLAGGDKKERGDSEPPREGDDDRSPTEAEANWGS